MFGEGVAIRVTARHPLLGVVRGGFAVADAGVEGEQLPAAVGRGAAAEDMILPLLLRGPERDGHVLPENQVAAAGVAPVHVAPRIAKRIVLVVEMIVAAVEDRAVRIVHPVRRRREMIDGPRHVGAGAGRGGVHAGHRARHGVVEVRDNPRPLTERDLIDVDMPPAALRAVHDLQTRLLPQHREKLPRVPRQFLVLRAGGGVFHLAVDEQVDARRAGLVAAADEEVQVGQLDGELRRSKRAGGIIPTDVAVHQSTSKEARHRLLLRQRAARWAVSEGIARGRPITPGVTLELGEDDFVGGNGGGSAEDQKTGQHRRGDEQESFHGMRQCFRRISVLARPPTQAHPIANLRDGRKRQDGLCRGGVGSRGEG